MYQNIKSCVRVNGIHSPFFTSLCGVLQGENLSPLLFGLHLNELEFYLTENGCEGISVQYSDDEMMISLHISKSWSYFMPTILPSLQKQKRSYKIISISLKHIVTRGNST